VKTSLAVDMRPDVAPTSTPPGNNSTCVVSVGLSFPLGSRFSICDTCMDEEDDTYYDDGFEDPDLLSDEEYSEDDIYEIEDGGLEM
jgi:hypothetical protein